ncbi:hypothetical protein ACOMHN_064980 [Nucella lapillus]
MVWCGVVWCDVKVGGQRDNVTDVDNALPMPDTQPPSIQVNTAAEQHTTAHIDYSDGESSHEKLQDAACGASLDLQQGDTDIEPIW